MKDGCWLSWHVFSEGPPWQNDHVFNIKLCIHWTYTGWAVVQGVKCWDWSNSRLPCTISYATWVALVRGPSWTNSILTLLWSTTHCGQNIFFYDRYYTFTFTFTHTHTHTHTHANAHAQNTCTSTHTCMMITSAGMAARMLLVWVG